MKTSKFDPMLLILVSQCQTQNNPSEAFSMMPVGIEVQAEDIEAAKQVLELQKLAKNLTYSSLGLWTLGAENKAFFTGEVTWHGLEWLSNQFWCLSIQLCNAPVVARPLSPRHQSPPATEAPILKSTSKRLLAVIDHGCPFGHPLLQRQTTDGRKTVIQAIWDQDSAPDFMGGSRPEGLGYGRQVARSDIQGWLDTPASAKPPGIGIEGLYRLSSNAAMRHRISHGSLVLGLLARGLRPDRSAATHTRPSEYWQNDRSKEQEPKTDLIFVQLPRGFHIAPVPRFIERSVLDAVDYIIASAARDAHVSVVIDYGTEMGPHDGSSWFGRAMQLRVKAAQALFGITLDLVFPIGNNYENRSSAIVKLDAVNTTSVETGWYVPRGQAAESTLDLWTHSIVDLTIEVFAPAGGEVTQLVLKDGNVMPNLSIGSPYGATAVVKEHPCPDGMQKQWQILIHVMPCTHDSLVPRGQSGVWKLRFSISKSVNEAPKEINLYTHWGGQNIGFVQRMWSPRLIASPQAISNRSVQVGQATAIWGAGCFAASKLIGGYEDWGNFDRAKYSCDGTGRNGVKPSGPDFLAPTEELPSNHGTMSITHYGSGVQRGVGTSFATPLFARLDKGSTPALKVPPIVRRGFAKKRIPSSSNRI